MLVNLFVRAIYSAPTKEDVPLRYRDSAVMDYDAKYKLLWRWVQYTDVVIVPAQSIVATGMSKDSTSEYYAVHVFNGQEVVVYKTDPEYKNEVEDYWKKGLIQSVPRFSVDTQAVAEAVKTLAKSIKGRHDESLSSSVSKLYDPVELVAQILKQGQDSE